jgi:signal transduction histidine kinase
MLRRISRSVRTKVMLLVLATTISALALSAAGLVIYDLRDYERQWTNDLNTQAEILARASAPALSFNDRETGANDLKLMRVRPRVLAAALYTRDGELFATYTKPDVAAFAFPARPEADGYRVEGDQLFVFRRVVENGEPIGTVYLRALYQPWARLVDYLSIIGVMMVASLVVTALLSGWLQKVVTAPVLEVARVAREVRDRRDYSLRARKSTDDEIGELVDSFNAMIAETGRRAQALREADQRKDEFLATLAHELRNPLAPLRNALEILRIAEANPAMTQKARDMMERQLIQLVRLVDDLLDVSRITTGRLAVRKSVIDVNVPLRDAIEMVRPFVASRHHQLDVTLPGEEIPVDGDLTRLGQVFSNLVHNAAKYTDPGGRIEVALRREGGEAVVTVRDNGIGLAHAHLDRIFEMFMQVDRSLERSHAGLGVGLSLAKRLVALHGGTLEARSEGAGKGSEFIVRLPIAGSAALPESKRALRDTGEVASRRVLLADDNADFANSLAQLLTQRGHDVRVVHDGAEALAVAARFHPQFAFLDIGMPKVHGYELARRLREMPATAGCVLVAVTGWGQEDDRNRAREAGFDRHLVKPVDPADIDNILASY